MHNNIYAYIPDIFYTQLAKLFWLTVFQILVQDFKSGTKQKTGYHDILCISE